MGCGLERFFAFIQWRGIINQMWRGNSCPRKSERVSVTHSRIRVFALQSRLSLPNMLCSTPHSKRSEAKMPRYEYRVLNPTPSAEKAFLAWVDRLDQEFMNPDPEHRSNFVRDALHELYLGRPYSTPNPSAGLAEQALVHSFDPRNATLEPEYYGDVDAVKYAERKPLIWFWMMYDRSPVGLNHWLGFRVRTMLARHVFKHCGMNVKIFHGVEVSFGYNLTVEDNCVIHKYVFLDDRGEIIIHEGSSISDYANVYSHAHDLKHGMVGSLGVAAKDVPPFNVVAGIPAKTIKVKSIAPEEVQKAAEKRS